MCRQGPDAQEIQGRVGHNYVGVRTDVSRVKQDDMVESPARSLTRPSARIVIVAKNGQLVTCPGPWTLRTLEFVDNTICGIPPYPEASRDLVCQRLLAGLGRRLTDTDITIPEFRAGAAAFKDIVLNHDGRGDLPSVSRRIMTPSGVELPRRHVKVLEAIDYIESAMLADYPLHEGTLARDLGIARAYLGSLLVQQTGLPWKTWAVSAQLRATLRLLVAGVSLTSAVGDCHWSSRQRLHRECRLNLGIGPTAYRTVTRSSEPSTPR